MRLHLVRALALATFVAGPLLSPSGAYAVTEWWKGSWKTAHEFGKFTVHFEQDGRKVTGKYKSGVGCTGIIKGEAEGQTGERLVATFDDRCPSAPSGENNEGQIRIRIVEDSAPLKFTGKFRNCGTFTCAGSTWTKWVGRLRD